MLLYENGLQTSVMHAVPIVRVIGEVAMTSIVSQSRTIISSLQWYPFTNDFMRNIINVPNFRKFLWLIILVGFLCMYVLSTLYQFTLSKPGPLPIGKFMNTQFLQSRIFFFYGVLYDYIKQSKYSNSGKLTKIQQNSVLFLCNITSKNG